MAYFQNEISCIIQKVNELLKSKKRIVIAIDGRCTSGKTTLAKALAGALSAPFVSCDDFFLPEEKRTKERLSEIGGNMERERLYAEVLLPFIQGKAVSYRPFLCQTFALGNAITLEKSRILIVEGSYSCHKELWACYDLHIFLDISKEEQKKRILARDPQKADAFFTKWIPMEEAYFADGRVKEMAELCFSAQVVEKFEANP